jgi:hypothetical protein
VAVLSNTGQFFTLGGGFSASHLMFVLPSGVTKGHTEIRLLSESLQVGQTTAVIVSLDTGCVTLQNDTFLGMVT